MFEAIFAPKLTDGTLPPGALEDAVNDTNARHSAVLLVARDRSMDESCRRGLSDAGVECVVSVPTSDGALELLEDSELFDAVVIGVGPGDVDAANLAQHMRRYRSDTPTVVVSPIHNLEIAGAEAERSPGQAPDKTDASELFRRVILRAVSLRQNSRLRRA